MDESHFKTLKELSQNGKLSQRDLSEKIGLSLGRINFIVKSLVQKGYIKALRFKNSRNKWGYRYVLTPRGLEKRVQLTKAFLERKKEEYEMLVREISELEEEVLASKSGTLGSAEEIGRG